MFLPLPLPHPVDERSSTIGSAVVHHPNRPPFAVKLNVLNGHDQP